MRLFGRERELADLTALVDRPDTPSRVATVTGAAGIGKSALLDAVAERADRAGRHVLRCRPTVVEADYPYAALADVLAGIDLDAGAHAASLPVRALAIALLRAPTDPATAVDGRTVGSGLRTIIERAAPGLVLVIDDVHWLDPASAAALAFALRRLPDRGVVAIAARRDGETGPTLPGDIVALDPLTPAALTALLTDQRTRRGPVVGTERALTGREIRTIVAAAGGNPLHALELARHAARRPAGSAGDGLAVRASIEALFADRLAAVDADVAVALAEVALLARPTTTVLRALGSGSAVERAEAAGLLDTSGGRITFRHPLIAAVVAGRLTASARRAVHRRLAEVVADPVDAVRHAALAAEEVDPDLASRLDEQVAALVERHAPDAAADLAVLAAELTPPPDPAWHGRRVVAARLCFDRGETDLAGQMLDGLADHPASEDGRRRELVERARIAFSTVGALEAARLATAALERCTTDAQRVELHAFLARVSYDDFDASTRHARRARELADGCEIAPAVLSQVLLACASEAFMAGHGLDHALFERAIALERDLQPFSADSAFASYAALRKIADELDDARTMLLELLRRTDDDGALPFALSHLPQIELWTGNWDLAEEYAYRHLDAALQAGQHDQASQARSNLAQIDVARGDTRSAAELAEQVRRTGIEVGDAWTERSGAGLLGLVAIASGDAPTAVSWLRRWHDLAERTALREPGYCRMRPDLVEALLAIGEVDEAAAHAERLAADAERLDRLTLHAGAARVGALVAAFRGQRATAIDLAATAVERYGATPLVVEQARALLTHGQILRRFNERAAACRQLEAALALFVRLGAEPFAERARQDLARAGGRPAPGTALTATERRVAHLAADGRTVRQIGDELFISPKTVEANLTRVYRKLGVQGRTALVRWAEVDRSR